MDDAPSAAQAISLMTQFAERTGVTGERPQRRYLWTDAFAVCNFLGLARSTGDARYLDLARQLVDRVHHVLGRHRPDDARVGWISGLDDTAGEAHPTIGGLRIGKPLPERAPAELEDPRLEWDRDGQYFHYLTRWIHALGQVAGVTQDTTYATWASELASTAHRTFVYGPPAHKRIYWKLSIDLSRPVVSAMGQHDPLDGFITTAALGNPDLAAAVADYAAMIDLEALATPDPLGIGGLLIDAYRLARLNDDGALARHHGLLDAVLAAALAGLQHYVETGALGLPADRRLAFRELGLAIGLAAVAAIEPVVVTSRVPELARFTAIRRMIEAYWLEPRRRQSPTWREHADINDVMLATSLAPEGFLTPVQSPRPELRVD